ncbi:GFA family protein [bacterium]|jgi:hypothetical protein|nr:GFA family protein [bacterium]
MPIPHSSSTSHWKTGGCHCGAIRFEVYSDFTEAIECNCSICKKKGYLHLIVPAECFQLLDGENELSTYRFGSGLARHYFCKLCGISAFYIPKSHPDGYSVNFRCLDKIDLKSVRTIAFDGQNWERNIQEIQGYNGPDGTS